MNIKPFVYENLTTRQRVIALLDASARNDETDIARLIEACPKKTYNMRDATVTDTIDAINSMALAVEVDIMGAALDYMAYKMRGEPDAAQQCLQCLSDIYGGWLAVLEEMGVSRDLIERYCFEHHPVVSTLLHNCPTPNLDNVAEQMNSMRQLVPYLKSRS